MSHTQILFQSMNDGFQLTMTPDIALPSILLLAGTACVCLALGRLCRRS